MRTRPLTRGLRTCAAAATAALATLALAGPATADTIHLTSGRSKTGIVVERTDKVVKLETDTGVVGIPLAVIESVESGTPEENKELRRKWAAAERQKQRNRAQRRAARRARRAAEAATARSTATQGGQPVAQSDAGRQGEAVARRIQNERRRVIVFRQAQARLDPEDRQRGPLAFQGVRATRGANGMVVTGEMLNISRTIYRSIVLDVLLVEEEGTPQERVAARRVIIVPELGPERLYSLSADFTFEPTVKVAARVVITASQSAR